MKKRSCRIRTTFLWLLRFEHLASLLQFGKLALFVGEFLAHLGDLLFSQVGELDNVGRSSVALRPMQFSKGQYVAIAHDLIHAKLSLKRSWVAPYQSSSENRLQETGEVVYPGRCPRGMRNSIIEVSRCWTTETLRVSMKGTGNPQKSSVNDAEKCCRLKTGSKSL